MIVGVDPGVTTGIFAVAVSRLNGANWSEVRCDYTAYELDARKATSVIELQVSTHVDALVACERYVITTRTARLTQQPAALEFIGVLKNLCADHDTPIVLQLKSDASRIARDSVLKRIGWFQRGQDHANDAARHALLALSGVDQAAFASLLTSGSIVSTSR